MRAPAASAGSRVAHHLILAGFVAAVAVLIAHSVVGMNGHVPKALLIVLVVAGAVVMLSIDTEQLLLGWLFFAPIFQESASASRIGHLLSLALYTAPPLVILIKMLIAPGGLQRRRPIDYLPALYAAFLFVSLLLTDSADLHTGVVGTFRAFYQTILIGVIAYYVVAFWHGRALSVVRISRVLLAAAALQAAFAVVEWGTRWNLWHDTSWQQTGDVRSIATLGNPALTGAFIGVGIVFALAVFAWDGPGELHTLAFTMLLVGFPGLYATKTRGPILATVVVAALCVLLSKRSRGVGAGALLLVALVLFMFWPQIQASSVYRSRIDESQNVQARLVLQRVSIRLAEERPVLGWGYNSFDRVKLLVPAGAAAIPSSTALQSTSHDTYLTTLVEFGAVGLALFLLPWVVIVGRAVRSMRFRTPDRWFTVAAVGGILVIGITGGTLDYRFFSFVPLVAWLLLGLLRRVQAEPI